MIKPEQIPDEVVTIAWDAFDGTESMREAIAAAINAWPMAYDTEDFYAEDYCFILPLPQEKNDD